jgi:hypothetical protein
LRFVSRCAYFGFMGAVLVDARELFGDLQRKARTLRFKAELAAFERQCSNRARTFFDMFDAVAWARQNPNSATYSMLAMDDDAPDQVFVARLARIVYGRPGTSRIRGAARARRLITERTLSRYQMIDIKPKGAPSHTPSGG